MLSTMYFVIVLYMPMTTPYLVCPLIYGTVHQQPYKLQATQFLKDSYDYSEVIC